MLYGFRMPELFEPTCSSGMAFMVLVSTVWLSSPLSVLSMGASAVMVTDSVALPTSSAASTRMVCAA